MLHKIIETRARNQMLKAFVEYLQYDGIAFFQMCVDEYGDLSKAVWNEYGIPHAVHFREGMQIRNYMRSQKYFQKRGEGIEHYFDNTWMHFISLALKYCNKGKV